MRGVCRRRRLVLWLLGLPLALWFVLLFTGIASADDCIEYLKNPKNLGTIPKGMLEDCMRTGISQAVITAILGGLGGGAIAVGAGRVLFPKEPQPPGPDIPGYRDGREGPPKDNPFDPSDPVRRRKWEDEGVVWDPQQLGWRRPRPDEYPPPENPPEEPPPYQRQNPRDKTPPECLALYDEYVKSQADLLRLEPDLQRLSDEYKKVTDWLNLKKTLITVQLGVDMVDLMMLGTGSVRMAKPISALAANLSNLLHAARVKLAAAVARRGKAFAELGELSAKSSRMAHVLKEMGTAAKAALSKVDELNELVGAASKRLKAAREALGLARRLDAAVEQRNDIVRRATEAEAELKRTGDAADKALVRKAALEEANARAFAAKKAELENARARQKALQVKDPQAIEHARGLWQLKQEAATAVNKAADKLRQLKYRVYSRKELMEDAGRVVEHNKAKLQQHLDGPVAELEPKQTRLDAIKQKRLEEIQKPVREATERFEQARNAVIEYDPRKPLDPSSLPAAARAERQALKEIEAAAEQEMHAAAKALKEYDLERNRRIRAGLEPERPIGMEDADFYAGVPEYDRYQAASRRVTEAEQELSRFDGAHLESVAEAADAEVKAAKQAADQASVQVQQEYLDGMAGLDQEQAKLRQQTRQLEGDVTRAKQQEAHIQREHQRAVEDLENSDIAHLPELEADHLRLAQEADAHRAKYEQLRDGTYTDPFEAEILKREIGGLEAELESWQDPPSIRAAAEEAEAAKSRLPELQSKAQELKRQEGVVEKQIGEMRDRLPSRASTQSLETEMSLAEAEVEGRQRAVDAEKAKAEEAKAREAEAAENERKAKAEQAAKDAEHEQAESDESAAQTEVEGLEKQLNQEDPTWLHALDDMTRRSAKLSDQFKPDWARATEDALKRGLTRIGKTWEWAFDGQSYQEMVDGIQKTKDRLEKIDAELTAKRQEYDRLRGQNGANLQALKQRLDQCVASNTFWQGPATAGHKGGS